MIRHTAYAHVRTSADGCGAETGDAMNANDGTSGRNAKLAAYEALRARRPELFVNPPGAAFEILLDRADQDRASAVMSRAVAKGGFPRDCADIGVVYRDPYISIVRDAVRFTTGRLGTYIRVVPEVDAGGAAVLPLLDDGRIVLLRHFRHASRSWHWEIPRGFGDPGEGGKATARRELLEELGVGKADFTHLGAMNGDTGMNVGADQLYLARIEAADFGEEPDDEARAEGIAAYRAVSQEDFRTMLREHRISDAFTLAAYALAVAGGLLGPVQG